MEISHDEFIKILKEKDKFEKIKDNLRIDNEKQVSKYTSFKQYKIKDLSEKTVEYIYR